MTQPLNILHFDDQCDHFVKLSTLLKATGIDCRLLQAKDPQEFLETLEREDVSILVANYPLPNCSDDILLHSALNRWPDVFSIVLADDISAEKAIELLRAGVKDILVGQRRDEIASVLMQAINTMEDAKAHELLHGSTSDTSEHKLDRGKLEQKAALLEMTNDAVAVTSLEGKLQWFNPIAERLFGWDEETIGKPIQDVLTTTNAVKFLQGWDLILSDGKWNGELAVLSPHGKKLFVETRWNVIEPPDQPKSILMVATDVSQLKHSAHLSARSDRLQSINTLAGGLSHELNNILTPCLMAVHLLRPRVGDSAQKFLNTLESSLERAAGIVRQVLTFAHGVEGQRTIIQIGNVLKVIARTAADSFSNNIKIDQSAPKNLWPVNADPGQLREAMMSLCNNARDAMSRGGLLTISAENVSLGQKELSLNPDAKEGHYVLIKVRDTGAGIPASIIERIFDPFFTTKEPGKGAGLGLSSALGVIQMHGGFINVSSSPGAGAEFSVYLPALPHAAVGGGSTETATLSGNGELVMIVDDEVAVREITTSILDNYGYKSITAADGTEALALYAMEGEKIDAIMMDIIMPHLDGIATIRALDKLGAKVGIIVTSGLANHQQDAQKASPRVKAFINKPFAPDHLLRCLKEALQETARMRTK
jgi:two-component system cell cycle sensor histidine kinase/response regulator CckA